MFFVDRANLAASTGLRAQFAVIANMREANYHHETALMQAQGLEVNAARIPADTWRDFDAQTKAIMTSEDGSGFMADLMPLARNVSIGKLVSEYRRYGANELEVRTSLDGQHAKPVNRGAVDFDGVVVPVHSTQIGINWREHQGNLSEGYDQLADDQAAATRYVLRRTVDNFINGTSGLTYKGYQAFGFKTNPNTKALNLGSGGGGLAIDLTSASTTYEDARKAFIAALQTLQGSANNAVGNVTFYLSEAIWFNLMRVANAAASTTETMLEALGKLPGVAGFKKSDQFTGNQFGAVILSSEYIRPIIGMPVTSTPIARVTPMDDFHVLVWGASGLQIKADSQGRSGALYAAG